MKKLVVFFVISALLAAFVLPTAVFAAPSMVYWQDDFSTKNDDNWIWDEGTTLFDIVDGKMEGFAEAVVQQSNFIVDRGGNKIVKDFGAEVTVEVMEDGGHDAEKHSVSMGWFDYYYLDPRYTEEVDPDGSIHYTVGYCYETRLFTLHASGDDQTAQFFPADQQENHSYDMAVVEIPESKAPVMDSANPTAWRLGMKLENGVLYGLMNGEVLIAVNALRGTATGTEKGSPLLLWNGGCWLRWDDFIAATPDLFDTSAVTLSPENNTGDPVVTTGGNAVVTTNEKGEVGTTAPVTQIVKEVVEKVVHSTDAEGNDVTEIETEIIEKTVTQAPQANTNTNTPTSTTGGSQTGDMAIVVIAVMIVALGSAIVVKKVTSK